MPDLAMFVLAAVVGAAVGSFLNVCVYRWPLEQSVLAPLRSYCPSCERRLRWYENIPVLSYAALRGRCATCRSPISAQYPLVELTTSLLWASAVVRFGPTLDALHAAIFLTILLGIALTDARHMVIPDQFSLGGILLGLAFAAVPGGLPLLDALVGAVGAYVLLWVVAWGGERLFRKPALGVGDIHMMAMIGAFLGLPGALVTIFLGSLLALAIGVPILWMSGRRELRGAYLPLGTFLALGGAIAHGWGDLLLDWYLGVLPL